MQHNVFHNQDAVKKLIHFIQVGGPEVYEYEEMTSVWNNLVLNSAASGGEGLTKEQLGTLFGDEFLYQTFQGFGYRKPHGYAGDFEIIDSIYQQKTSTDARFQKWDKYFHSTEACKAVRNRKEYFVQLVKDTYVGFSNPMR